VLGTVVAGLPPTSSHAASARSSSSERRPATAARGSRGSRSPRNGSWPAAAPRRRPRRSSTVSSRSSGSLRRSCSGTSSPRIRELNARTGVPRAPRSRPGSRTCRSSHAAAWRSPSAGWHRLF